MEAGTGKIVKKADMESQQNVGGPEYAHSKEGGRTRRYLQARDVQRSSNTPQKSTIIRRDLNAQGNEKP